MIVRRMEGYARSWERGTIAPAPATSDWSQPGYAEPAPLQADPFAPAVAGPDEGPAGETRRRESVVATADGPLAPPPPPPG